MKNQPRISSAPFILVIFGDSTAGKSTLLKNLRKQKKLRNLCITDIDDETPPIPGRENWRKYRVEELLYQALQDNHKSRSAVIGGWIWPHEIIESQYFDHKLKLRFLFLNNSKTEYVRRLKLRQATKAMGEKLTSRMISLLISGFESRKKRLENQAYSLSRVDILATDKFTSQEILERTCEIIKKLQDS